MVQSTQKEKRIGRKERAPLNSVELQRAFDGVYKNFFHTHDVVLSAPGVLTWGADISHGVSVLRIKQKLPMKTFCGANFNNSGNITFRTLYVYDIQENIYKKKTFEESFKYNLDPVKVFLLEYLQKQGFSQGVEIDFLSEAPPGHGFAFSSVFSVLLTFLIESITGKIDPHTFSHTDFSHDHERFEELFAQSLELSRILADGKNIGGGSNYTIMLADTVLPTVYFSPKTDSESLPDIVDLSEEIQNPLYGKPLYKGKIEDFLGIRHPGSVPLDYGILFMGQEYRFDEIESKRAQTKDEEKGLDIFIEGILDTLPLDHDDLFTLQKLLHFEKNDALYKNIDNMNLRILGGFHSLLKHPNNEQGVDQYIEILQAIGLSSFSYQKENPFFFDLKHYFYQSRQFDDEKIALLPFNSGKIGGSFLFVMKPGKSRTTFQKAFDRLKKEGYSPFLYHASWRDGVTSDGVRLEQFLSQKIFSEYTKKGDVFFKDSGGRSYCDDYDAILKTETEGILLDTIEGRIYLKGKKLTSKDIHSQNATIDVLKLLLQNMGQEVSNARLPVSTYSQNKNEILSKVIIPIKKITQHLFSTELSLTCSGGITQYYLRLEKDEKIPIGIIEIYKD